MKTRNFFIACILLTASMAGSVKAQDTIVTTFSAVHQGDGNGLATRIITDTFLFPHDLSGYEQIHMNVILTCPAGGCEAFSRFASMQVFHQGEWFEIGRYATPYGVACNWTLDVNDYRSMLTDTVILKSFIDTRSNPGWNVSVVFDFISGIPVYNDIKVENLWLDYNVVYGDNTKPVNLPPVTKTIDYAAAEVKMKMVTTGHGQGNTDNAAEFAPKTHSLWVNGSQTAQQYVWRADCAINACSPQNGPWQTSRAGWCAGAETTPYYNDITSLVLPGQPAQLEYRLQNYTNACNPNNASCVAGITCADCDYNNAGHLEPHYKISGQLITYKGNPTGLVSPMAGRSALLAPNPSAGIFYLQMPAAWIHRIAIYNLVGQKVFVSEDFSKNNRLDLSLLPPGIYLLKAETVSGMRVEKIVIQ